MPALLMMGIGTAISAGSAISGAAGSRKAAKNQKQAFAAAEKGGAFDPLVIAKPQKLKVPSVGGIMGQYRQDVTQNYGGYEDIAQRFSASEQASNRAATQAANPNYYNVLQQLSNTAMQAGKGMLPADVRQQILQNANEDSYLKGFSYGKTGGGGNVYAGGNDAAANLALRNLGLSSLDMMKYGNALGQDVLGISSSISVAVGLRAHLRLSVAANNIMMAKGSNTNTMLMMTHRTAFSSIVSSGLSL
jgi:hypothetical protein